MNLANDLSAIRSTTREFLDRTHGMVIGGEVIASDSSELLAVVDPSTAQQIASAAAGNANDVDRAVAAARAALEDDSWAKMRAHERERLMHRLATLIDERADDIAELVALESGRLLADARGVDADFAAHILRYMAGWPSKISGETLPVSAPYMPPGINFTSHTTREPIGVVAAITPWNVPLGIAAWKIAPALAAGCTVVLKPAEQTPLSALLLGELVIEAGFPAGVVNVITGTGPGVGEPLVSHPGVDKVSFTGSTQVGKRIGEVTGRLLKSTTLELGGKSPVVIMPDANLETAIPFAAGAIFANQGQNCCAGSRLYVHRSVYDQVVEGVAEIANGIQLGPNLSLDTQMGPLVSAAQQNHVSGLVEKGIAEGAEVLAGAGAPDHSGFFYKPTVLAGVKSDMSVVREEIFGPVLVSQAFDDLEQAIKLANDSEFGLGASIFTKDIDDAQEFSARVDAGTIWVNVHNILDTGVPFGGFKNSGLGTDLGKESVLAHTRLKANYLMLRGS